MRERKTDRRRHRPGDAEYVERTGEWSGGQSQLQRRFIETAFEYVPTLKRSVRAIYDQEQLSKTYDQLWRDNVGLDFWKAKSNLDREVLKAWGQRWNLADEWCLDWVANVKIGRWYSADGGHTNGITRLLVDEVHSLGVPIEPFHVSLPGGDPTATTKIAYRVKTRAEFQTMLKVYFAYKEQQIESIRSWDAKTGQFVRHYFRAPEIRQGAYFRYLVAYQVCGVSLKQIAETTHLDYHAVQRGINLLASLINLTLRPSRDHRKLTATALKLLSR